MSSVTVSRYKFSAAFLIVYLHSFLYQKNSFNILYVAMRNKNVIKLKKHLTAGAVQMRETWYAIVNYTDNR